MVIVAAYILVGFLVSSAMCKFTSAIVGEPDELRVVIFVIFMAIWPAIAAFWLLAWPIRGLLAYINFLSE